MLDVNLDSEQLDELSSESLCAAVCQLLSSIQFNTDKSVVQALMAASKCSTNKFNNVYRWTFDISCSSVFYPNQIVPDMSSLEAVSVYGSSYVAFFKSTNGSLDKSLIPLTTHMSLCIPTRNFIVAPLYQCQHTDSKHEDGLVVDTNDRREVRFVEDYTPPGQVFYPAKEHTPVVVEPNAASTSRPRTPPSPITYKRRDDAIPRSMTWQRPQDGALFMRGTYCETPAFARRESANDETYDDNVIEAESDESPVRQAIAIKQRRQERAKERLASSSSADDHAQESPDASPLRKSPTSPHSSCESSSTSIDSAVVPIMTSPWSTTAKDSLLLVHRAISAKEAAALDDDAVKVREALRAMDLMMAAEEDEESVEATASTLSPVAQRMLARRQRMAELEAKQHVVQQTQVKSILVNDLKSAYQNKTTGLNLSTVTHQSAEQSNASASSVKVLDAFPINSTSAISVEPSPAVLGKSESATHSVKLITDNDLEQTDDEDIEPSVKIHAEKHKKKAKKLESQTYRDLPLVGTLKTDESISLSSQEIVSTASPLAQSRARLERQRERMRERVSQVEAASPSSAQTENEDTDQSGRVSPTSKTQGQRTRKKEK